jgi:hypothetical protein
MFQICGDVSFPFKVRITKNLRNPTILQSLNSQFRFILVKKDER